MDYLDTNVRLVEKHPGFVILVVPSVCQIDPKSDEKFYSYRSEQGSVLDPTYIESLPEACEEPDRIIWFRLVFDRYVPVQQLTRTTSRTDFSNISCTYVLTRTSVLV